MNQADGRVVEALYQGKWYPPEKSRLEYWLWSGGPATVTIRNPQAFALASDVKFDLRSNDERSVTVRLGDRVAWQGLLHPSKGQSIAIPGLVLPPGDTRLDLVTDRPTEYPGNGDLRRVSFSLRNLKIVIKSRR